MIQTWCAVNNLNRFKFLARENLMKDAKLLSRQFGKNIIDIVPYSYISSIVKRHECKTYINTSLKMAVNIDIKTELTTDLTAANKDVYDILRLTQRK